MCEILETILPEREPNQKLWVSTIALIDIISLSENQDQWLEMFVKWELNLLNLLGFSLKLDSCGVSGSSENLTFISPKTGNAINSSQAGKYKDRLFLFPSFLGGANKIENEVELGLKITNYFLNKWLFKIVDKKIPDSRLRFQYLVMNLKKNT